MDNITNNIDMADIVIRDPKFIELVRQVMLSCGSQSKTPTESVKRCILFIYKICTQKNSKSLTGMQILQKFWYPDGTTRDKMTVDFNKEYNDFCNDGNCKYIEVTLSDQQLINIYK